MRPKRERPRHHLVASSQLVVRVALVAMGP